LTSVLSKEAVSFTLLTDGHEFVNQIGDIGNAAVEYD
jgi:hypothetical protein